MPIFDKFPQLQTERLFLREVTLDDAADAFEYLSDDEVMKGHGSKGLQTVEEARSRLQGWYMNPFLEKRGIRFGIALQSDNKLIGSCGFWRWEKDHYMAEIGYELNRAYQRQGVMKEALSAMIEFGFSRMGLNRIEAKTDHRNIASQQTLLSLGFQKEGILREAEFEDGEFVDLHVFSLLKREWITNNQEQSSGR